MKPVASLLPEQAQNIRYILMDIDDTLTREGKLLSSSYRALWELKEAGLVVMPVTGRPAGWCDLIARQWPVDGVVGENGALVFWEESAHSQQPAGRQASGGQKLGSPAQSGQLPVLKQFFHPDAVLNTHPVLAEIKDRCFAEFPLLRLAKDQFARMFDLALDFAEEDPILPLSTAVRVKEIAEAAGAVAKVSSIHVNIWMGKYDKLTMAERFLADHFGWDAHTQADQVLFVGDSPNDEPMFARFPLACAVANIRRYEGLVKHWPAFVSQAECGDGFAEIARELLEKRA